MRLLAILSNLALSLFTVGVVLGEGMPTKAHFVVFSLLLLFVPVLTAVVLGQFGRTRKPHDLHLGWITLVCNAVMVIASCWVVATQYPSHPSEAGLLPYTLLVLFVPLFNLLVLGCDLRRSSGREPAV